MSSSLSDIVWSFQHTPTLELNFYEANRWCVVGDLAASPNEMRETGLMRRLIEVPMKFNTDTHSAVEFARVLETTRCGRRLHLRAPARGERSYGS